MRREGVIAGAVLAFSCSSYQSQRELAFRMADDAFRSGQAERAEEILRLQLRADPRDVLTVTRLAVQYERGGRDAEALRVLERLPADVPVDVPYRQARAHALTGLDRWDEAAAVLTTLDAEGGSEPATWERLLSRIALAAAGPEADRAIDRLPPPRLRRLVETMIREHRLDGAARLLARMGSDPDKPRLRSLLDAATSDAARLASAERQPLIVRSGSNP